MLRFRARRQVGVLDIDPGLREAVGDARQHSWFVIALDHQHVILEREHASFAENHERFGRVTHDHTDDRVIDRIRCRKGMDVYLRGGQFSADARKCAGTVSEEDGELGGGLNRHLRTHGRENARVPER